MRRYRLVLLWIGWLGILVGAKAATLQSVEIRQEPGRTVLFFALSESVPHRVFTLINPDRVVVDFEQTRLAMDIHNIVLNAPEINRVRSGQPYPGTLRLVFEMKKAVLTQPALTHSRQNFQLDLLSKKEGPTSGRDLKAVPLKEGSTHPIVARHAPGHTLRSVVVVLDPGHGGKDPGAHGPRATREKHLVLAVAKKLKTLINRQAGMKAVLTRDGDYYIGLRERLQIARRHGADVFVSIHADAFNNPTSAGASVFALSQRGATSEAARWLAEKENNSELGGVNLSELDDKNGLVRTVLIDLSQTATVGASLHLGEGLLGELDRMTHLHHHHVEQARFVVLKSPDIPSVLVEMGFISNPQEELNLQSLAYQERLAQAIFKGLKRYFWENPPQGTLVEYWAEHPTHYVKSGETLLQVSKQYQVSFAALQKLNHLSGNTLQPGQVLRIPSWV